MMDRSRITAAVPGTEYPAGPEGCVAADVVIIDLARQADALAAVRAQAPTARIIAFGPHVDEQVFEVARRDGADRVLARSRFFRDIASAIA